MPGILPMKVIKVGNAINGTTRIAQACDRCRSKKIRCDGVRPSCTQCVNVGFECKTSDKLSRRAFPRGYTESLEERVRCLEAEVRELKDLLDEKDEKIDMLSRIHSHSPQSINTPRRPSAVSLIPVPEQREEQVDKDDVFKVQQPSLLLGDEESNACFMGASSGRNMIDSYRLRLQEAGRSYADIDSEAFLGTEPHASCHNLVTSYRSPPRIVSDQMINIFFQEWAPLFPVLHRPAILQLYGEYIADPESVQDKKSIAQLNLVFGIAALSSGSYDLQQVTSFEAQWQEALESCLMDSSLATLQCLVLAQIYCLQRSDHARLLKYKGIAVGLSYRLGLHQPQRCFALDALTSETRKKVFWTLYTLDCFSAAQLGMPKLMKEEDVHCEFPVDTDDEYITENGFLPTLPGEFTKVSSALALFRVSRILAKVLNDNYTSSASHTISFRGMASLVDELDNWQVNLPQHLRLQFAQDRPSTNVTSSRSPVLSLTYHYIRSLIYRPAVCAGLGNRASSAVVAIAGSSKSIIQIIQLLEERSLSFSMCMNKHDLLVLSGFGLLFQNLDLDPEGHLIKENQRMVSTVADIIERSSPRLASEVRSVNCARVPAPRPEALARPQLSRHNSEGSMLAPLKSFKETSKQLKAIASRFSPSKHNRHESHDPKDHRRATVSSIPIHSNQSHTSLNSTRSEPATQARSEPTLSPVTKRSTVPATATRRTPTAAAARHTPNLDYLSFGPDPVPAYPCHNPTTHGSKIEVSSTDWERLLSSLENGQTNIYDGIYGGPPVEALLDVPPLSAQALDAAVDWSHGAWGFAAPPEYHQPPPQSVLSFSDESLTSGGAEYDSNYELGSAASSVNNSETYRGILIPELSPCGSSIGLGGLDGNFGL
ncbi:DNA-binding transcription factor cat8 [Coniosporium tulheliwenetii]|uniref:DNA-binding transcription factor cat8 n=1 Tax=Coniosporium tulheliwenetii TaxID=3383036 RepID=A0ACC2YUQ7_9PEZI|nr:DNA-binding transcription factor cat8 [Cladosporium sp. JES 115]